LGVVGADGLLHIDDSMFPLSSASFHVQIRGALDACSFAKHGVEAPGSRHTLEFVASSFLERERRANDEILNCLRNENL
jgi:hypothetical protein